MSSLKLLILTLLAASAACGPRCKSKSHDVATNLGTADAATYYYYQADGRVYRGKCEEGQPILRSKCATDLRFVDAIEFKDRFALTLHTALVEVRCWCRWRIANMRADIFWAIFPEVIDN